MAHQVVTAAMLALLNNWAPSHAGYSISTLVLILPIYPAIAPIPLPWLVGAGFLAASMDPLTWLWADLRDAAVERTPFIHIVDSPSPTWPRDSPCPHHPAGAGPGGAPGRAYTRKLLEGREGEVYEATHRSLGRRR
jgi:hypothetical protein